MRITKLNKIIFFCVVFFITTKYLRLQFDSVNFKMGKDVTKRNVLVKNECNIDDEYNQKTALIYSDINAIYGNNIYWEENVMVFRRVAQNAMFRTASWIQNVQQNIPTQTPHWWPEELSFRKFPMMNNETYDEGLWCPPKTLHTDIRVFSCVTVDSGSAHPSVIGGVMTYYYPNAPGYFFNEIMPKLLSLHDHVPIHIPLLWPDTMLAKKVLHEMQLAGEFKDRTIFFA
jgi:hypothetical protein